MRSLALVLAVCAGGYSDDLELPVAPQGSPAPGAGGTTAVTVTGRPISNAKARGLGWKPQVPSWRTKLGQ